MNIKVIKVKKNMNKLKTFIETTPIFENFVKDVNNINLCGIYDKFKEYDEFKWGASMILEEFINLVAQIDDIKITKMIQDLSKIPEVGLYGLQIDYPLNFNNFCTLAIKFCNISNLTISVANEDYLKEFANITESEIDTLVIGLDEIDSQTKESIKGWLRLYDVTVHNLKIYRR